LLAKNGIFDGLYAVTSLANKELNGNCSTVGTCRKAMQRCPR
jgi:hypothetical protein